MPTSFDPNEIRTISSESPVTITLADGTTRAAYNFFFTDKKDTEEKYSRYINEGEDSTQQIVRPSHYKKGNGDMFDELYERLSNTDQTFTSKEVFVEIMKFTAMRYINRFPNKNDEDLGKGLYTLRRLEEYLAKWEDRKNGNQSF